MAFWNKSNKQSDGEDSGGVFGFLSEVKELISELSKEIQDEQANAHIYNYPDKFDYTDADLKKFQIEIPKELWHANLSLLHGPRTPRWPINPSKLISSGAYASCVKACLDDWEPIVGIVADGISASENRVQEARNFLMSIVYLNIIELLFYVSLEKKHSSEFQALTELTRLRDSWFDDYPNSVREIVGWWSHDHDCDAYNEFSGQLTKKRLEETLYEILKSYDSPHKTLTVYAHVMTHTSARSVETLNNFFEPRSNDGQIYEPANESSTK